jgi:hypothetical protein
MGVLDNNRVQGDVQISGVEVALANHGTLRRETISGLFSIEARSHQVLDLLSSNGNSDVRLPDETTIHEGWSVRIFSSTSSDTGLLVSSIAGGPLLTIQPGEFFEFTLIEATLGKWASSYLQGDDQLDRPIFDADPSVAVGHVVYVDKNGILQLTNASASSIEANAIGVVSSLPTPNKARVALNGRILPLGGYIVGEYVFLDPTSPGQVDKNSPQTPGQWVKIVGIGTPTDIVVDCSHPPILIQS